MNQRTEFILELLQWLVRRPRLTVRIIDDNIESDGIGLKFEVENRSASITSLQPLIKCSYYYLSRLRIIKGRNYYFVREVDRQLNPYKAVILSATSQEQPNHYNFSWFRTYLFKPSRGIYTTVRIRNALLEPLGIIRFYIELIHFRLTGKIRSDQHSTIDDLNRLKRSQGPH